MPTDQTEEPDGDEPAAISAEVAGGLSSVGLGGLVGLAVGGPVGGTLGAAAGAVATPFIIRGTRRILDHIRGRGRERVITTVIRVGQRISERRAAGEELRSDGFFAGPGSDGEEVAEGILLVAEREFESRKMPLPL